MIEYSENERQNILEKIGMNEEIEHFIKYYCKIDTVNTFKCKISSTNLYNFLEHTGKDSCFTRKQLRDTLINKYKIKLSDYDREIKTRYFLGISIKRGFRKLYNQTHENKIPS